MEKFSGKPTCAKYSQKELCISTVVTALMEETARYSAELWWSSTYFHQVFFVKNPRCDLNRSLTSGWKIFFI